jgi:hypothetical protein
LQKRLRRRFGERLIEKQNKSKKEAKIRERDYVLKE